MRRLLPAVTILLLIVCILPAEAIERVYFGDIGENKIRRCGFAGANLVDLVTSGLSAPGSIAIDRTGGKMYWTDWPEATAHIMRADLDGSNVETVLSGLSGPYGIALDVAAGKMYWTEFSVQKVRRANLDGTNIEDLVTTGMTHPNGIALDVAAGKMYWTDGSLFGNIQRANLDGTSVETIVPGLGAPMEIALDLVGGKMYWTDLEANKVQRANLDGTGVEDLINTGLDTPVGIALDLDGGRIFFSNSAPSGSQIKRCNLDGTGLVDIVSSGIGSCYGLTIGPEAAECSDATLDGPWIAILEGLAAFDYTVYLTFDGMGTIAEMGSYNVPDPAGTYAVASNCSLSGTLWSDGYQPFSGFVDSDTTADIGLIGAPSFPVIKVMDPGALEGCWSGQFVQDDTDSLRTVSINVDFFGVIYNSTGLAGPVSGKMFYQSGYLAGHIKTGHAGSPWEEISIRDATLVGDVTMTGTFGLDCSDCPGGVFSLTRCDVSAAGDEVPSQTTRLSPNYPNPFNPQTTISYTLAAAGPVNIRIYDAAGRVVTTLVDEAGDAGDHEVTWNGRSDTGAVVTSGVYFVRLESAGLVQTRKIVLLK